MKTEYRVPQGSVLSALLFNINSIDMFYKCEDSDIENYADDTEFFPTWGMGGGRESPPLAENLLIPPHLKKSSPQ